MKEYLDQLFQLDFVRNRPTKSSVRARPYAAYNAHKGKKRRGFLALKAIIAAGSEINPGQGRKLTRTGGKYLPAFNSDD